MCYYCPYVWVMLYTTGCLFYYNAIDYYYLDGLDKFSIFRFINTNIILL